MEIPYLYRGLRKLGILNFINLTGSVKIESNSLRIPILGELGLDNLTFSEPWMSDLLSGVRLNQTGTFIDFGANIGQTLIKLKTTYPYMPYLGFEPNPTCVYYLDKLIKVNKWNGTTIFPVAISRESGLTELYQYNESDTDSSASIISNFRNSDSLYGTSYVPCYSFTDIERFVPQCISCIKIDVEGGELEILTGLQAILMTQRPYVLCEILPVYSTENSERLNRQNAIQRLLETLDYSIYRIKKDPEGQMLGLLSLNEFGIHSNLDWCEYLFSPNSLKNKQLPFSIEESLP
ncbi:MAG: FkbM family methyltransferase [Candidatus Electrothrix scaldis]|nr:MAG: FkbM family methyltransferase [Candidatus Electrothrix sp. GW3-3]